MEKKNYYVYALIDPRDNQYFYIGKGKGKRYLSHLKPKKSDFNFGKLEKIKEIQKSESEVKIKILFSNLDENSAFELEKIIIYKLGREFFNEGILTNLNPGGQRKPKDSIFYPKDFEPIFDLHKLDFVSQEKFKEIPTLSKFNYLETANNNQHIFRYDPDGNFDSKQTLDEFFSEGISGHGIDIIKALKENELPIYSGWIYSKYYIDKLYVSNKIPFADFDVIDDEFNREFDKKFEDSDVFDLECNSIGVLRIYIQKDKNIISLTSYYPSGNKKSFKKNKDGKPFELASEWYENGNLKEKEELKDGDFDYVRTTFYENGNKHISISNLNKKKTYNRWFENGKKELEIVEGIYNYYNELGNKINVETNDNKDL